MIRLKGIDHFINLVFWRLKNGWDAVIVITGTEGAGKSTFAIKLAMAIEPSFCFDDQLIYSFDFYLRIMNDDSKKVVLFDEAVVAAYCRNWNSKQSRQLVEEITRNRYKLKVQIFIIPSMASLEKYIREHRVWCWIHIPYRGIAEFHMAKRSKWGQVSEKYKEIRWEEVGRIRGFKALSPIIEAEYMAVKEDHDEQRREFISRY